MTPEAAMRLALREARRASGRTFPNPAVGAVVFRGERVLARGYTRPAGGPHAEVVAIERARRRHGARALRGAAMAVTLEPCSHIGRTDPCAELVAEAGLRRLYVGHPDPHRAVAGRGLRRLRRAGIAVEVGVLEAECREQHRGFLSVCERGRPFVVLKLASTLDGRIATARGESRWITGPEARETVHRLRERVDAILVGASTARADDPELTARRRGRVVHRPIRVVLDGRLALPATAKLLRDRPERTWLLCAPDAALSRRRRLAARGARVLDVRCRGGRLDLGRSLRLLAHEGLTEILVEGGGEIAADFLRRGLVDEVHWFSAARLIGGDGRPALGPLGTTRLARAPALSEVSIRRVGDDVHVRGTLGAWKRTSR
jgi:diaminohydroxyphosphoribosylaminopyrimidine deaminase/5-amino-6-(5-phosphoribosylamino)uracil reductase